MPRPAGLPKTGGRKPGVRNKITASVKEAAQAFTDDAIGVLAGIMKDESQPAAARVSAASAILDRGHGKPKQAVVGGDEDDAPIAVISRIERVIVDPSAQDA